MVEQHSALLDLRFIVTPRADGASFECEWNTALFDAATVDALLANLVVLIESVPDAPDRLLEQFALQGLTSDRGDTRSAETRTSASMLAATETSPLELAVCGIFAELLGVPQVKPHENFFARGGDSMRALQLVAQIEETFGAQLSVADLTAGPTPRGVSAAIATSLGRVPDVVLQEPSQDDRSYDSLRVTFNATGRRPPIICGHAVAGTVTGYSPLAEALGSDQPLVALRSAGLMGECAPLDSLSAMAKMYVAQVAGLPGPRILLGWSYGGAVAYAMAEHLTREGAAPALVGLIDSWLPFGMGPEHEAILDEPKLLAWLALTLVGEREDPVSLSRRIAARPSREQRLRLLHDVVSQAGPPLVGAVDVAKLDLVAQVLTGNCRAILTHRPGVYTGKVVFFRPAEEYRGWDRLLTEGLSAEAGERFLRNVNGAETGWRSLLGSSLVVEEIPGNHFSMMSSPHVQVLAERLRAHLPQ
jgi:thioesterase domain-containing protein/acyl carrier protein